MTMVWQFKMTCELCWPFCVIKSYLFFTEDGTFSKMAEILPNYENDVPVDPSLRKLLLLRRKQ